MRMEMDERPLNFGEKPRYAVQLKLTKELKEVLINAHNNGVDTSMCLGNGNAVRVPRRCSCLLCL